MSNISTELMQTLLKKESVEEFFRAHLERAVNEILKAELSAFLGYEKYSADGIGSGNSRNGFYMRSYDTEYGTLNILVPRDRNGQFKQQLLPSCDRRTDDLETAIIKLYSKGITTREIADIIEHMYGHNYSPATVSNLARSMDNFVKEFHERRLEERYVVLYMDATYLSLRRDTVAKEALHVIMGITPEGSKEILDYAIYPTESSENYREMIKNIKKRGVRQVLMVASDGLGGMRDVVAEEFPKAVHQQCWVHLARDVARKVRPKDRKEILEALKAVYRADNAEQTEAELEAFLEKYAKKYPSLRKMFERAEGSLFSFYGMPEGIRKSVYTTNLIERSNKELKRKTKAKEQFPNEASLERFIASCYGEQNRRFSSHAQPGFKESYVRLMEIFDEKYGTDTQEFTQNY